ncbi:unnamed protein product [Arabidopsis arenosa]|uniref:Uncharacterized protein n=1 Tax=Arabidopsis arenosa TaxID=38785 RepID=A0A8S1ZYH4_ARAAE|nr:unnamed protein product [Arabidopsis arenosa]
MSFDELLTIPEQDEWVYSDGKSTTCVAFILAMYKAAGVFGPLANHIQVTEFTVRFFSSFDIKSFHLTSLLSVYFFPILRSEMHTLRSYLSLTRLGYRVGATQRKRSLTSVRF